VANLPTFGTGFAQAGFTYDQNLSPNNQAFSAAVLAVALRNGTAIVKAGGGGTGGGGTGTGSVTSVAFADASTTPIYLITGSPVTTSGTLVQTLGTQSAHQFFAGPSSGANAQPNFRAIVSGDVPHFIDYAYDQVFYSMAGGL
jgi:hypothetical protein